MIFLMINSNKLSINTFALKKKKDYFYLVIFHYFSFRRVYLT